MFEETNEAGIGIVIRNSAGEVMALLSEKTPLPSLVKAVEILATRRADNFVQEIGIADSIFEGDSQSIVLVLKNGDRLNSDIGHLVIDTLSFVNTLRS